MSSMVQLSAIEIAQAKLMSCFSQRPAHIKQDIFAWNGYLIDRATAVVALLKANNSVPVNDGIKMRLLENYRQRFAGYVDLEKYADSTDQPDQVARIWFSGVCRAIKPQKEMLTPAEIKSILISLHI